MPKTTADFESTYARLNVAQKQAVDTIEGPVLVLAGPGTGKTQVLTARIANILKQTDADPGSILALTFTEAATKEMRERLIKLIGEDGYYVKVCTFHGFCSDVISENPDRFSRPAGMQNITDLEKVQVIQELLEKGQFRLLKPIGDPLFYLPFILSAISDLKREGFTFSKYSELVSVLQDEFEIKKDELSKTARLEQEKLVNKNIDLLEIYGKYQQRLKDFGRFDFDDMINWVVESFETDADFLLGYQERFQYILVDEYQDTNSSQNRLIFALSSYWGEQANVFAVGDPNQSIYRFQGASKENIMQFQKRFPLYTKIVLDQNYRSTKRILNSSAELLKETSLDTNISLPSKKIRVAKFSSAVFEDDFIVKSIQAKIKNGIEPENIAVIAKENKDIDNLVNLFKAKKIPYKLAAGVDVLSTPYINQFLKILKVTTKLQGPIDDIDLFTVLNYPCFELNPLSIFKTARTAHQNREALTDTLLDDHPDLDDNVVSVFRQLISWNSKAGSHTLPEMFEMILQESGLLTHLLALPQALIELNRFNTLFEDAKNQSVAFPGLDLFGYVANLTLMEENRIKLEEKILVGNDNAVTLTTAHKSKGLEWRVVYIYRFADSHWGNKTRREMIKLAPGIINFEDLDKEDKNAEERRLFYVAMTRSKQYLYLMGATEYDNSAKMVFPAMFLGDLPNRDLVWLNTKKYSRKTEEVLSDRLTPKTDVLVEGEGEYLQELLKSFKLSPTALNSYLECPYKFKLDNLYRIPRTKAPAMCFGTAVHHALENLYQNLNNTGEIVSQEDFILDFEVALRQEIMTDNDYNDRLNHGRMILAGYYDHYKKEFERCLFTEKSFGTSLTSQIHLGDIPLTGKADRIDETNKEDKHVRFVDYKTGKVRTRGEIEGTTKTSDGGYFRQLTFYRLLADLDKSFPHKVIQTELDFIEPDSKGEYHRERFNITEEHVENLKTLIADTMKKIRSLDFGRTDDLSKCDRCPFRNHCFP